MKQNISNKYAYKQIFGEQFTVQRKVPQQNIYLRKENVCKLGEKYIYIQ